MLSPGTVQYSTGDRAREPVGATGCANYDPFGYGWQYSKIRARLLYYAIPWVRTISEVLRPHYRALLDVRTIDTV